MFRPALIVWTCHLATVTVVSSSELPFHEDGDSHDGPLSLLQLRHQLLIDSEELPGGTGGEVFSGTVTKGPGLGGGSGAAVVDGRTSCGAWQAHPHSDFADCGAGRARYITEDLGQVSELGQVQIWGCASGGRSYCNVKVALSTTGDFEGEEQVVYDSGTGWADAETEAGTTIAFAPTQARYVRQWRGRNTLNSGIHFLEMQVCAPEPTTITMATKELPGSTGGGVFSGTVFKGPGLGGGSGAAVIDGTTSCGAWQAHPHSDFDSCAAGNARYITEDLGGVAEVGQVQIWGCASGGRSYCNVKVALSTTGEFAGEEEVVYDSGTGWADAETDAGTTIAFAPKQARYVRHWRGRNTLNSGIHFLEMQVSAPAPTTTTSTTTTTATTTTTIPCVKSRWSIYTVTTCGEKTDISYTMKGFDITKLTPGKLKALDVMKSQIAIQFGRKMGLRGDQITVTFKAGSIIAIVEVPADAISMDDPSTLGDGQDMMQLLQDIPEIDTLVEDGKTMADVFIDPEPAFPVEDTAEAVGDPHLTTVYGEKLDLDKLDLSHAALLLEENDEEEAQEAVNRQPRGRHHHG